MQRLRKIDTSVGVQYSAPPETLCVLINYISPHTTSRTAELQTRIHEKRRVLDSLHRDGHTSAMVGYLFFYLMLRSCSQCTSENLSLSIWRRKDAQSFGTATLALVRAAGWGFDTAITICPLPVLACSQGEREHMCSSMRASAWPF